MKRIRLFFSFFVMLFLSVMAMSASCDASYFTSGDFDCRAVNGTVYIQTYRGEETHVVIPSELNGCTVTVIDCSAFYLNSRIISVIIPPTVKTIGDSAFANCERLESVLIPSSVTSIGDGAFAECISLKQISLPSSVTCMSARVFFGCKNLKSVTVPPNVSKIEFGTFSYCTSLETITIPASVRTIDYAFNNCICLKTIYYGGSPEQWQAISVDEDNDQYLKNVNIKCSVQSTPKISRKTLSLYVNNTAALKVTGTLDKITWSSSKKSVATVSSDGVVKGKKKGSCTITAKFGSKKLKCKVTVKGIRKIKKLALDQKQLTLSVGKSYTLAAVISPTNASQKALTWSSSNKSVAKVANGTVKALKVGTATITAKVKDGSGKKATCKVTVKKAAASGGFGQTKTCTFCNGTKRCPKCNGTGMKWHIAPPKWLRCGVCNGWKRCPRCDGTGKIRK